MNHDLRNTPTHHRPKIEGANMRNYHEIQNKLFKTHLIIFKNIRNHNLSVASFFKSVPVACLQPYPKTIPVKLDGDFFLY